MRTNWPSSLSKTPTLRFVVTSTPRSGTAYVAHLFRRLGVRCGHETMCHIWTGEAGLRAHLHWLEGESSWMAIHWSDLLPGDTVMFHQIRHPLHTLPSICENGPFDQERAPWQQWLRRHYPEYIDERGARDSVVRFWLGWHAMIERRCAELRLPHLRYRVEDLDATLASSILRRIGRECDMATIERAIASLPKDLNTRGAHGSWSLGDVSDDVLRDELRRRMALYGYQEEPTKQENSPCPMKASA